MFGSAWQTYEHTSERANRRTNVERVSGVGPGYALNVLRSQRFHSARLAGAVAGAKRAQAGAVKPLGTDRIGRLCAAWRRRAVEVVLEPRVGSHKSYLCGVLARSLRSTRDLQYNLHCALASSPEVVRDAHACDAVSFRTLHKPQSCQGTGRLRHFTSRGATALWWRIACSAFSAGWISSPR